MSGVLSTTSSSDGFSATSVVIFDVLAFLGVILNSAVLAPVLFSPNVRRRAAWCGIIFGCILFSLSYLFTVAWQLGQPPPFGMCMFQAALVYPTVLQGAIAYTCFVIDFYMHMSALLFKKEGAAVIHGTPVVLIAAPWVAFLISFVAVFASAKDASLVQLNHLRSTEIGGPFDF